MATGYRRWLNHVSIYQTGCASRTQPTATSQGLCLHFRFYFVQRFLTVFAFFLNSVPSSEESGEPSYYCIKMSCDLDILSTISCATLHCYMIGYQCITLLHDWLSVYYTVT